MSTIPFALFGQLDRTRKISSVVNWKNNKNCEVELYFKRNGVEYMFHRCLAPSKFQVYENGNLISSTASKLDFQKQLENEVLGIDFKTFMNLIYTNSNSSVSLLKAKKQDKRQFLERMFDLGYFSHLSKRVQKKIVKNQENITEVEKEVYKSESIIEVIEKDLSELILPDLSKHKKEINRLKEGLDELPEDDKELLEKYKLHMNNLETDKQKYEKLHQNFVNKIKQLNRKKSKLELSIKECNDSLKDKDEKDEKIEEILSEKYGNEVDLEKDKAKLEELKTKEKEHDIKLSEILTHIKIIKGQYESYKEQDLNIKPGDVCPECSREMEEKYYQEYKNNHDKKVEETKKELVSYKESFDVLKSLNDNTKKEKKDIEKSISTTEKRIEELNNYQVEYNKLVEKNEEIEKTKIDSERKLSKYEKVLVILDTYSKKYLNKYNEIVEEYNLLKSNIEESENNINTRSDILNDIKQKEAVLLEQEKQLERNKEIKVEKEKNLKELQDKILELNKNKKSLFTLKDYLVYFKDMLKDEEVKQYAIGEIIPFLTKQANHYLSQAGYEYYLDIDSWLDITIKGPGVKDSESGNMSGGEEKSIDLSLQYAFLDLIYSKSLMFPNVLIQDEILDSSIDSESLENFLDIVKAKQRENDLSLYIISHRKEVDLINPDHVIEVEKVNGYSKIKEL